MLSIEQLRIDLAEKEVELCQKEKEIIQKKKEVIQLKIKIVEAESAKENPDPEVTRYDDTGWGQDLPGKSVNMESEQDAIQYAIEHKYQTIVKRPNGYTYYFRDKITSSRSRNYDEILNTHQEQNRATTWVLKY